VAQPRPPKGDPSRPPTGDPSRPPTGDPSRPSTGVPPAHVFADFIRQLPSPVAFFDREVRYLAYSEAWLDAYRLPPGDLVGRCHYDVFPEIGEEWKRIHRECLAGRTISRELDAFQRADGTTDFLRWTVTPWRDPDGAIGGIVMYTQVVTDFVRTAQRLAEREAFIRELFERSPIGLNLSRLDGRWVESNPAFLEIIGYPPEEADGLTYWDLTPPAYHDDEQRQLDSLDRTGRYGPYEKEFIRKDGSLVPVRLNGFLIEREGERYIWSLIEDLRERRRLERDVEHERMKAIQASKLATLGEMAAGVAHEINNPLAIIDGFANLLPDLLADGDEARVKEATAAIGDATRRAARIVDRMRRFARQADGEGASEVPIAAVIDEAVGLCRTRIRNHGVELRVAAAGEAADVGPRVRANEVELAQVLINLINNAFHAALQGRESWIAMESRVADGAVEVRVRDSGPGVPHELRERVFEPFFTTKKPGEGTGLGLSISRDIVERLGGALVLEAAEGGGTCFVLRLPVVGATASGAGGRS